jgi:NAD(P)-dependent dehydrogenase (short-subunit alcohol dehydrogenase family)
VFQIPLERAYGAAMTSPDSRIWLITGSSSGFGRTLAEAALAAGDRVVATARRPETLDDLVAGAPERVLALPLDVTDQGQIDAAVAAARSRFGRIDVLVNNAGHGSVGAIEEVEPEHLRALMETMFFGPVALTKAILPHMRERGSGAIVQMSSMGGQLSPPGFGAYCSAKWALEAASEALAAGVAPLGLRVLIVEPGSFRTEFGGARLHQSPEIAAYVETAGQNRAYITGVDGTQPGDPRKAAEAIVRVLDEPEPPLRLALGDDAVDALRAGFDGRRAELDAWEHVSRSAVFA